MENTAGVILHPPGFHASVERPLGETMSWAKPLPNSIFGVNVVYESVHM